MTAAAQFRLFIVGSDDKYQRFEVLEGVSGDEVRSRAKHMLAFNPDASAIDIWIGGRFVGRVVDGWRERC
jgi:hypothetical protein